MENNKYRRILFAVDAQRHSRLGAPAVARLAEAASAEVVVLHVQPLVYVARWGYWEPESLPEAQQLVREMVTNLTEAGVKASGEVKTVERSRIADTIAETARDLEADLVALGSRGLSDLAGMFLGSVSHRVVQLLDCPVLVCPQNADVTKAPIGRILVAVAGGAEMTGALDTAATIAGLTGSEVVVVHVDFVYTGEAAAYAEPPEEGQALVDRAVAQLQDAGVKAMGWSFEGGSDIARDIADTAGAWNADLIIVGSRRHSDLAAVFAGSVDHKVMQFSEKPVLVANRPSRRS
jgi:nucleotide-binding universal stress UspA family protein